MARADTVTIIPLDNMAKIMGIDPLHFNQIVIPDRPEVASCDDVWHQFEYQSEKKLSRESLARALHQAEQNVARYLGYYPLPYYIINEEHQLPRHYRAEVVQLTANSRGMAKSVRSHWGYIQEFGKQAKSLVEAGAVITYTDTDADGYKETATVTVVSDLTDPEEIRVFYPDHNGDYAWEIRPVDVEIAGGSITITFRRDQAVTELEMLEVGHPAGPSNAVNGLDDLNFLDTVDVYRVYTDPSEQAMFYAEGGACACGGCSSVGVSGCLYARDARRGFVSFRLADWDAETETFVSTTNSLCTTPDKMVISYRAGRRNEHSDYPNLRMSPDWERAIVYYALTMLDTSMCGCAHTRNQYEYMTEDLARANADGGYQLSPADRENPFGTQRAAIQLYRMIQSERLAFAR